MTTNILSASITVVVLMATSLTSQAALIWTVGIEDNNWPVDRTGGGPNAAFVPENGAINPLPGSPNNVAPQGADNDYYFAGAYTSVVPTNGLYAPIGFVSANENAAERGFIGSDLELRYHFNLPVITPLDFLSITVNPLTLDDPGDLVTDARFGIEIYFNNVLVQSEIVVRPANLAGPGSNYTTPLFSLASVGAVIGPGTDNIVSLRGINYYAEGGGNLLGIDVVRLDSVTVPEPSSIALLALASVLSGGVALARRKRSQRHA